MKTFYRLFIALGAGLMAVEALAADTSTCSQGALSRTISVIYSEPGQALPCEVLYDKPAEGQSMTLWRAQNEAGYCEARAAEFVDKLTELGWTCSSSQASDTSTPDTTDSKEG